MVTHYKIPHKWHTCYNYKDTVTDKIYFISQTVDKALLLQGFAIVGTAFLI